jgi:(1->4)-alpha-D-glucan 1-alpha-D-glucosylmutase
MEYVIYQTLVGMWPTRAPGVDEQNTLCERVSEFARKAGREAKGRTSWTDPDEEYESVLADFIRSLFRRPEFLRELQTFVEAIAPSGAWNAIARTVLHLTSPGFPDIYQGDELWNFSLVDPDNRRPVSYDLRSRLLAELNATRGMSPVGDISQPFAPVDFTTPDHDALKLAVIRNLLAARAAHAPLFAHGSYRPLAAHGPRGAHIVAFERRSTASALDDAAIIVVPRLTHVFAPTAPPTGDAWRDTVLHLPASLAGTRWRCAISGRELSIPSESLAASSDSLAVPISTILTVAPVSVLLAVPSLPVTP